MPRDMPRLLGHIPERRKSKMSVKPILFNTEMVWAIMDGRKTVTRRLIKPQPSKGKDCVGWCIDSTSGKEIGCAGFGRYGNIEFFRPPYQIGDILYVRETWRPTVGKMHTLSRDGKRIVYTSDDHNGYEYKAHCLGVSDFYFPDGFKESEDYEHMSEITSKGKWHPSIHMPKEAARIWLKVTDVRVERLKGVTEEQAAKEGAIDNRGFIHSPDNEYDEIHTAREHFEKIWDSTIPKQDLDTYGWDANPWVWVIEFERCEKPEEVA
jgi:hypothetical protein